MRDQRPAFVAQHAQGLFNGQAGLEENPQQGDHQADLFCDAPLATGRSHGQQAFGQQVTDAQCAQWPDHPAGRGAALEPLLQQQRQRHGQQRQAQLNSGKQGALAAAAPADPLKQGLAFAVEFL
ncbi:hypothetical protein D3C80_480360 [compost metagenome]